MTCRKCEGEGVVMQLATLQPIPCDCAEGKRLEKQTERDRKENKKGKSNNMLTVSGGREKTDGQ